MRLAALAFAGLIAGCGAPRAAPAPPVMPPPGPGLGVTLAWPADVDLDLYVTDPAFETVYYGNPRSRSGGRIVRDARCADGPAETRVERVQWPDPPPGRYRVAVDFPERCDAGDAGATYRLMVHGPGVAHDTTGLARLGRREPVVLEFTIEEGSR